MEENRSLWQNLEFPEICLCRTFSKIAQKLPEDSVKWKRPNGQSCAKFYANDFRHIIFPNRTTDAPGKSVLLRGTESVSGLRKYVT